MNTINVFADSGHHYSFLPIDPPVLTKYPQFKVYCDQDRAEWRPLNHPWIRGRFATRDGVPGMWIAVESNVGTIQRGSTYEPKHQIPAGNTENPSPYPAPAITRLPQGDHIVTIQVPAPDNTIVDIASFQVIWKQPAGDPIEVDLVVDFGNTRTVVLALEDVASQSGKLSSVCKPIRFVKQGFDYEPYTGKNKADDTCAIVDSWFVLHEPIFANMEPPAPGFQPVVECEEVEKRTPGGLMRKEQVEKHFFATKRVPQMFVELSPVVMGDSARDILANIALGKGGNYSLSSPKRYAWDNDIVGKEGLEWWTMVLNRWNPKARSQSELPKLAGSLLRFLPTDGRDWTIDNPPNEEAEQSRRPRANPETPTHPRSDAMSWAALSIIELAHRQITSEEWRRENKEFVPRRLKNVLVTFPSGWSAAETDAYRRKWQKAIDIFTLTRLSNKALIAAGGDRPQLMVDLDEAVASQLPFVYSEIRRMGDVGENWISLYGRGGAGTDARLRIMTVDIGGGTTDISVVEYMDRHAGDGVDLEAKLLFRDSSSIAGDALVKEIIDCVLLPALGARFHSDVDQASAFENIFLSAHDREGSKARWARITKLVFLPIVRQWLRDLTRGEYGSPDTGLPWSPDRIWGAEGRMVDPGALEELNDYCRNSPLGEDIIGDSEPISYCPSELENCITRIFSPVIQSLAKYVSSFEVDLVTLSGKPSELPQVRILLEDLLPVLPQRIIQAKDFPAGDWYPMTSDNRINDAKSVTAVGAALYQAVKNGKIPGWKIERTGSGQVVKENYWGSMPSRIQPHKFSKLFLAPGESQAQVSIQIGAGIGRKMLPSAAKPEQVYRFRWKDPSKWTGAHLNEILQVQLGRVPSVHANEIEGLEILSVTGAVNGQPVQPSDVELQLCTLEKEEFWLDTGRFDVVWPSNY
jgi:hypothetical protein